MFMIAIPQFLDFPDEGQTAEICDFFLKMLKHKNKALYMHSQQVANYAASIAAKLGLPRPKFPVSRPQLCCMI